jgi:acyl-CoA synthetase (AMP-forming)/AMP-acid ligase II
VGRPVPGYELRIRPDGGRAAAEGELWVRGPTVMAGYLDDPAATSRALERGWLRTGDRVRREPDGSHTFLGRRGDRFTSGGGWVDADRVRAVLRAHAAVADAAVLPVEGPDGLVHVGLALEAAPGRLRELRRGLLTILAHGLAANERPRAVLILAALPTTSSGKVDRAELRRRLTAALARTAPPVDQRRRRGGSPRAARISAA